MLKFLIVGDIHEGVDQPISRIDDYEQCKNAVAQEIRDLAAANQCKAVLQLGDFLDAPKFGYDALSQIIYRWKPDFNPAIISKYQAGEISLETLIQAIDGDLPWVGVVGNHELTGTSLATYDKTSLHFLTQIGFMTCVDKMNPVIFKDEDGSTVAITGAPYHSKIDKDPNAGDYIVEEKLGDVHLHLVHGYGTNKSFGTLFPHTTTDKFLPHTQADFTFIGHDHIGFDTVEMGGKQAVNPGAPFLRSIDEIDRIPKVLLLTVENGKAEVTPIPLSAHPSGSLVLSNVHQSTQKAKKEHLQKIKESVEQVQLGQGLSMTDIIDNISENHHLPAPIKDEIKTRVQRKMVKLQAEQRPVTPYHLTTIELINFQSHGRTVIPCHEGLNVFVGESRNGKTAIQRALSFVFEGSKKVNARRYIKKGTTRAEVRLTLSNGYVITRWVSDAKTSNNGYTIFNPNTNEIEEGNTQLIPYVQELLGFYPLMIDEGNSIPINFKKQQDGWFFIGDQLSAPDRAKVIGSFYGTHYADAVGKEYDSEAKVVQRDLKKSIETQEQLQKDLAQYAYLEKLDERLAKASALQSEIEQLVQEYQAIESGLTKLAKLDAQMTHLEQVIEKGKSIQAQVDLAPLRSEAENLERIHRLMDKREHLLNTGKHYAGLVKKLKDLGNYKEPYEALVEDVSTYRKDYQEYQEVAQKQALLTGLAKKIQRLETNLAALPSADDFLAQKDQLVQELNEGKEAQTLWVKWRELKKKEAAEESTLAKAKDSLTDLLATYRETLTTIGQCPICLSPIEEDTINHVIAHHLGTES